MKILVRFLTTLGNNEPTRSAWIGKNESGQLTFGTIYTKEYNAQNLNDDDFNFIKNLESEGKLEILKVVN